MRPGTLYGALDRLVEDGLIEADREEVVDGRLRRYYKITDRGAAELSATAEQMRRNAEAAAERLRSRGPGRALGNPVTSHRLAGA